ncbi:RNA-binding cell elongation regulator Jag/EloR [Desulfitibacter alkalitolerans]|uniref:RNA-binding cell elongation regulator Jag/EloR n=1 Tax=Desulfitibacter alkalitolerans TaxID=264641 RepID=UPI000480292E|nr:RNA-binding cell elongation regulator Jag/EloR [Desulfitibacter alkalitolerans]
MITVETRGKTIDEAIEKALKELQTTREDVKIEILEEGSKGFFGLIGSKDAKVKVTKNVDPIELAKDFLTFVTRKVKVDVQYEVENRQDHIYINIKGKNIGILIGRRGETLESLQYLTNLAVQKKVEDRIRIVLDIEGYRSRREQTLVKLANRLYEKVKKTHKSIVLEPMNPHERRIIHTALQNKNDIQTYSEGDEPYRKVVISLKR